MQSSKQKIGKQYRRMTPPESKINEMLASVTNLKEYFLPKQANKKSINKTFTGKINQTAKKLNSQKKSYLINKTVCETPFQKPSMLSYISTPNDKSFNLEKSKMIKGESTVNNLRAKEQFQSTQDENYSEETVRVNFIINGKRVLTKFFTNFLKLSLITTEFMNDFSQNPTKSSFYGLIGFEMIPFNYSVSNIINEGNLTFQWLLNEGIREITLTPLLLKRPINYDKLQFRDFQIVKFLGSGGFSQVYLAKCKLDYQYCALKFIRKDSITSAKKVKMLQNEKNILFTIKHQNLIDLLYAFQTQNYIVFGLQYCPNGNLYSFLQKVKHLKQDQAKSIFTQILNGIEYLHANNILFRDIKLENILFDSSGKIKITDFGLSKPDVDENQITYSYCGSPEYMAPEMLTKSGHSYQVDFYALGILLFELLFGKSPFYASKKEEIFHAILHSEPKFPKVPAVSKEVKSLIKGLLAKNPAHRIGSLKGVRQIMTHPWIKNFEQENIPTFNYLVTEPNSSIKNETQDVKQLFQAEQSTLNYEKCFFSQNFVNRLMFETISNKIVKFNRQNKLKNNFIKSSSSAALSKKKECK